ncbi:MAG TPA: class I SAM-dependent methyltransferase [Casimicrobiaceae bacterium]
MAPLSEERATRLAGFVSANLAGTVTDVGCGWGELLIRVLQVTPDAGGLGIDLNHNFIEYGRALARARGVDDRLSLIAGDVKDHLPTWSQALICIGASQIWGPPVEAKMPLDYRSALGAVREKVKPGSPVIYGEGIWAAAPTPAAIAPLGGRLDEYVFLPDLLEIARDAGFAVVQVHQASLDEWDAFESGFTARYARWLANNPGDHPDAQGVREQVERQRNAYFRGYRSILGMAYLAMFAV